MLYQPESSFVKVMLAHVYLLQLGHSLGNCGFTIMIFIKPLTNPSSVYSIHITLETNTKAMIKEVPMKSPTVKTAENTFLDPLRV